MRSTDQLWTDSRRDLGRLRLGVSSSDASSITVLLSGLEPVLFLGRVVVLFGFSLVTDLDRFLVLNHPLSFGVALVPVLDGGRKGK